MLNLKNGFRVFLLILAATVSTVSSAEEISGLFKSELKTAERGIEGMLKRSSELKLSQRQDATRKVEELMSKLSATLMALQAVQLVGRDGWFLYEGESCQDVCQAIGLANVPSPEGAMCASGELRPTSAIGIVQFTKGCWGGCSAQGPAQVSGAESVAQHCYRPGQKRDRDRTDLTVGCFCQ
jgi:hypothetical protein